MADSRTRSLGTRWLGVGLASIIAVVTIVLTVTDRLALYINPSSAWFAVGMSVVILIGTIATFALPLGAEADHGHDIVPVATPDAAAATPHAAATHHDHATPHDHHRLSPFGVAATVVGGVAASGIAVLTLVLPPASLSAELAMSRDVGAPPLFAGADVVSLATTGDTAEFGVGEWSAVFATATNPDAFDGTPVTLTGFVTPGDDGFALTRLVITHCVIDAQSASVPVSVDGGTAAAADTGQWVTVTGTVRATQDGRLSISADEIAEIDEPGDPYEY
ncbi:TIGR03943 family putative permease subunit [Microbacterium sp. SLBN-146]|uniref:TIGR03943 family putative permease subunit n=1 Tax=Microbacterium sp. SLBN-146 TaxID=2768457 RepID=UPI00115495A2|nr:TIGR03943 family protein [Microbacterium sp. SLBN-146]TQJ30278.1 putative repeat protein (TIGR03943 family) [Microbacterium sp. SLBN-146]